ncbi:MAG TPA: ATP-binding protein, partial [Nitrososphaerales archaeon]|nr:ATP-binding protein [Nitrososphaerales archaeon]
EFYIPNAGESGQEGILLGAVRSAGREYHDFRLQLEDLKRHVSVLGMTGSGKSTTAGLIVRQVAEAGLPTLVLDWHSEFRETIAAAGGKVVAPGKDDFAVNPLEVGLGVDAAEHIAMVSDIFSDIYHFTHPQAYMFRNALQKRLAETSADEVPTISALVKTIEAYPLRSAYDNETKVALLRRLVPLTQGQPGKALGGSGPLKMEELLNTSVCIELGHIRDIQSRAVFCDVMLKMVYEEKVKQKGSLDHLTVIEEARNIAPARRPEDPPSVGERMISELRKFGEAMMFVAQFPTHLAAEVMKNSGTKIVHRLAWPDDVSLIGDSLGLNQKQREHLTRLRVGEAVVGVARIRNPILVQVRADALQSGDMNDRSLARLP